MPGSLTVVGTGYKIGAHITAESLAYIKHADKVLSVVARGAHEWLRELNPTAESMLDCYAEGKERLRTYREMVDRILFPVRAGLRVCAVFYGHPGVACNAGHASVRKARKEGYTARMLPGVSAADCLFADLGIDPSGGLQSFEATDLLIRKRRLDVTCPLILWQASVVGVRGFHSKLGVWNRPAFRMLVDKLTSAYSSRHRVTIYEASSVPLCDPMITTVPLNRLEQTRLTLASTLYIPPRTSPEFNRTMVTRLNSLGVSHG
jgi:uncharacterized protein YabN with tetrapyrrole methylase and pyrophosphatase domain